MYLIEIDLIWALMLNGGRRTDRTNAQFFRENENEIHQINFYISKELNISLIQIYNYSTPFLFP